MSAYATTPISSDDLLNIRPSNDPSVLALYCHHSGNSYYQSRVAMVQSADRGKDYGLTTAHGLINQLGSVMENCFLRDFQGGRYPIANVYIPSDFIAGTSTDWAVLSIDRITVPGLVRFKLPEFSSDREKEIKVTTTSVTFPTARGLGYSGQTCMALPAAYAGLTADNILVHDCRAIGGQSGSPISTSHHDEDVLMGIHLGKSFVFKSPITKKPEHYGFFRFIDQDIVDDIQLALRSMEK